MALVTTISLTEGADDSRSAEPPVGLEMPRPTPHWKLFSSIHFSCPSAVHHLGCRCSSCKSASLITPSGILGNRWETRSLGSPFSSAPSSIRGSSGL